MNQQTKPIVYIQKYRIQYITRILDARCSIGQIEILED